MFEVPLLPRTLAAALRDLTSPKIPVRAAAVRELVPHADAARDEVCTALIRALRDEAPRVRVAAATALADLHAGEALPQLLFAVDDDDMLVRQMSIMALGEIGDARATPRLTRALSDRAAEVRFQAVIALPRVMSCPEDAVEAVLRATEDKDPLVCHIALRMAEEIATASGTTDQAILARFRARARVLVTNVAPEVRVVSAILIAREGDPRALEVLVQVATGALRTPDREDEATAIELVGELLLRGAERGLEQRAWGGILGLRRDPFAFHARVALARMGHERARREILRDLSAIDPDRSAMAVAAAGRARLVEAEALITQMRDGQKVDAQTADEALLLLADVPRRPGGGEAP